MSTFTAVTDKDLERARQDPVFRQKLLSDNLDVLLAALKKMRTAGRSLDRASARQIREGLDLADKLTGLLQAAPRENEPPQAA